VGPSSLSRSVQLLVYRTRNKQLQKKIRYTSGDVLRALRPLPSSSFLRGQRKMLLRTLKPLKASYDKPLSQSEPTLSQDQAAGHVTSILSDPTIG